MLCDNKVDRQRSLCSRKRYQIEASKLSLNGTSPLCDVCCHPNKTRQLPQGICWSVSILISNYPQACHDIKKSQDIKCIKHVILLHQASYYSIKLTCVWMHRHHRHSKQTNSNLVTASTKHSAKKTRNRRVPQLVSPMQASMGSSGRERSTKPQSALWTCPSGRSCCKPPSVCLTYQASLYCETNTLSDSQIKPCRNQTLQVRPASDRSVALNIT